MRLKTIETFDQSITLNVWTKREKKTKQQKDNKTIRQLDKKTKKQKV